jgi:hypothetical protein
MTFLQADKKIAATSSWRFTNQLAREISWFQPLYITNGTQVRPAGLLQCYFVTSFRLRWLHTISWFQPLYVTNVSHVRPAGPG